MAHSPSTADILNEESIILDELTVLKHLDYIVQSVEFKNKKRLQELLSYLVKETLAGNEYCIKAYSIAVDVFDRPASFDAATDTIVRVQAGKLRRLLGEYYRTAGRLDPLRIEIPKGTYVPQFLSGNAESSREEGSLQSTESARLRLPRVGVYPFKYDPKTPLAEIHTTGFGEQLSSDLCNFPDIEIVSYYSMHEFHNRPNRERSHVSCEFNLDYVIHGSVSSYGEMQVVAIRLVDCRTNTEVWAKSFEVYSIPEKYYEIQRDIVENIAARLVDTYGIIPRTYLSSVSRLENASPGLVECQFFFNHYGLNLTPENHDSLYSLLLKTSVVETENPFLLAMLAILEIDKIILMSKPWGQNYDNGLKNAYKSLQLDAENYYANFAMSYLKLISKEPEEVLYHVKKMLDINPLSAHTRGVAGWFMALAGEEEIGLSLIEKSKRLNPLFPSWFHFPAFIHYYSKKEYKKALHEAHLFGMPDFIWGQIVRIAAYTQLGKSENALNEYSKAATNNPTVCKDPHQYISYFVHDPKIADQICQDFMLTSSMA